MPNAHRRRSSRHPTRSGRHHALLPIACATLVLVGCYDPGSGAEQISEGIRTPKVLLIGIDGVRVDVLAEVTTPNLDALAAGGFLIEDAGTTTPSVSGPAWSSMLIGVWPDKHGVYDNEFTGKQYEAFPDFLTRIERVRPEMSTAVIADWLPLVQAAEGLPTVSDAVDVKHVLDGYELGWAEADARGTELAVELLSEGDPDALFVYLGNPDETSHEQGSIGAEYREAIELADRHVGRIVEAVRTRASYDREDWLVLVSTDHGRTAEGGHGGSSPEEMTIFVIANGDAAGNVSVPERTFIVDIAVTALAHLGIDIAPDWELDGSAITSRTPPAGR